MLRRVDLGRNIAQAAQACHAAAERKGVDLAVAIHQGLDTIVEADAERVTHVLRNLLANALKFTSAGGWVRVRVEPDAKSARKRARVGQRLGHWPARGTVGAGVRTLLPGRRIAHAAVRRRWPGLSIVRHLVALHGGRVGAESAGPGRGSTFWFSLPRRQAT